MKPQTPTTYREADQPDRHAAAASNSAARRKRGPPKGNKNAIKHGMHSRPPKPLATVEDAIAHLGDALARLDAYIADHADELTVDELARLAAVYGMNLSRFVRMLRDHAKASGDDASQLEAAIDAAIALASEKLGADLNP